MEPSLIGSSLVIATALKDARTEDFDSLDMNDFLQLGDECPDIIFADNPDLLPILKDEETDLISPDDPDLLPILKDEGTGSISMIDDQPSGTCLLKYVGHLNEFDDMFEETSSQGNQMLQLQNYHWIEESSNIMIMENGPSLDSSHGNQIQLQKDHWIEENSDRMMMENSPLDASQGNQIQPQNYHWMEESLTGSHVNQMLNISLVEEVTSTEQQFGKKKEEKVSFSKFYFCPFNQCSYKSTRRDKLDRHMGKHVLLDGVHPNGKKRKKTDTLPQRQKHNAEEYKCPECPYSCTVYEALKNHQTAHASGNANLTFLMSCKICGEDHPSQRKMEMHMKKHKINRRFCCDICNWSSLQLKKVIQHRRIHTGEKPHLCPHCNYRSSRRDNLRSHVRRIHNKLNVYIDTFNPK